MTFSSHLGGIPLIAEYTLGNGTKTLKNYNLQTGRIDSQSVTNGLDLLQFKSYEWDSSGNMLARFDHRIGQREDFDYDNLNRLTSTKISAISQLTESNSVTTNPSAGNYQPTVVPTHQTINYDALGNISFKSDVGNYSYDSNNPHRLLTAGNQNYQYDNRGNIISDGKNKYIYNNSNQVISIDSLSGVASSQFIYNGGDILLQTDTTSKGVETRLMLGNVEFYLGSNTNKVRRNYAGVVVINEQNGNREVSYLHKDHLGSTDLITNENADVVQKQSFDAFGKRRDENQWVQPTQQDILNYGEFTSKGYTGHEMLDGLGIIHMKGRIYDANIGRFLQADPIIQAPSNIQNYNRYSYVLNNPLAYTDPSGYFITAFVVAVSAFVQAYGAYIAVAFAVYSGYQAYQATGSLNDAFFAGFQSLVISYISAGAATGVSEAVNAVTNNVTAQLFYKALGHGLTQGTLSYMQGGKFGAGFASAFVSKIFTPLHAAANKITNGLGHVTSAIIGGTTSVISGGKFANGTITSAIIFQFNERKTGNGLGSVREGTKEMPDSSFNVDVDAIDVASLALDFTPVLGDIKGFYEANSFADYVFAVIGLIPGAGDAAKAAYKASRIKGYTKHGIHQAISRDDGRGVGARYILDAVKNTKKTIIQSDGKVKYEGRNATVILNKDGKIITSFGKPRN